MNFQDLTKKKHVRNHPLFKNSQRTIEYQRRALTRHAQDLAGDNSSEGGVDTDDIFNEVPDDLESNDKKLSSLVFRAIKATEDIFTQLDFPLPPKVSFNRTRNIKYSNANEADVVSGLVLLNCKIATINNMTKQLEVPVSIARGQVIPPSIFFYEGREPLIAQSTIDAITERSTSYELPPVRQMFSPPMNREEREIFTGIRNEMGWKPRNMGGLTLNKYKSGGKEATYTPQQTPAAYEAVVEKMQEAQEAGEDTFPRAWHYILRNYILQTINTADKDAWEVHLINDGWAINPWQRSRRRGKRAAGEQEQLNELYDMFEDFKGTMSAEEEMEIEGLLQEASQSVQQGQFSYAAMTFDQIQQMLNRSMSQDRAAQVEDFGEEEIEEVVEEVVQKMYNGTKMPMEVNDSAKFNTKDGPIRGKIIEINPDEDYLIIGSKGIEYRVHCEDIEPLNSTYKNKFSRKKSQHWDSYDDPYTLETDEVVGSEEVAGLLLTYHGGMSSPLYSVGSNWLGGHALEKSIIYEAIKELEQHKMYLEQKQKEGFDTSDEGDAEEINSLVDYLYGAINTEYESDDDEDYEESL